jgi:hypothetical protein
VSFPDVSFKEETGSLSWFSAAPQTVPGYLIGREGLFTGSLTGRLVQFDPANGN